jgi:retron-type reverse transcriptase
MKRIKGLFDPIADYKNLASAAYLATRNCRRNREIVQFFDNLENELNAINQDLHSERYRFGPYQSFQVRDTKTRTIHAPPFRDRVVHHAMIRVLGPIFEQTASPNSYACRVNKGVHMALKKARIATNQNPWYGKVDVERFYDSISHRLLYDRLARRFQEGKLLSLFRDLLASYCTTPECGIPIGSLTSQYLGNFLLDSVDRTIRQSGIATNWIRYMDDTIVWGSHSVIHAMRDVIITELNNLGLKAKNGGEWNRCGQGVPCLGFVVYPGRVRLGKQARRRLRRRYRSARNQFQRGEFDEFEFQDRITSLFAHAKHADDCSWRRAWLYSFSHRDIPTGDLYGDIQ